MLGILLEFHSGAHAVITSLNGPPFSIRFAVCGDKGWMELHDKSHPQAPHGSTLTTCKHGGSAEKRNTRRCRWFARPWKLLPTRGLIFILNAGRSAVTFTE